MKFWEDCNCNCHGSFGHVSHCVPCCSTCSYCHKRISYGYMDKHEKECRDVYDPLINTVRLSELIEALKILEKADLDISSLNKKVLELTSSIFDKK